MKSTSALRTIVLRLHSHNEQRCLPLGRAHKGLLASVQPLMSFELSRLRECSVATRVVADVRLLSRVSPQVGLKQSCVSVL